MQAIVLAADSGTSLYPLTAGSSKAMVRVFNKPLLEHTIDWLTRHNIRDIIVSLADHPEQIIDYFGSGEKWGVSIQYLLRDSPTGTAADLRRIASLLRERFIVVTAGSVTDLDLSEALEHHQCRSALATMLVYESPEVSRFGAVDSGEDGRVARFIVSPTRETALCRYVGTGFYIFEPEILDYIPYLVPYDLASDVFPRLIQNQEPFYCWRPEGYWRDLDNIGHYRDVHFDAVAGRVRLKLCANKISDGIWIGDDADIHPTVKIRSPFYVGNGVKIAKNSTLGRFAVIGDVSDVHEGATITQSVLGTGSVVEAGAQIYGSVTGSGFRLRGSEYLADEVATRTHTSQSLRMDIGSELLSQPSGDEHAFTWSGFEIARLARGVASTRHLAA